MLASSIGKPHKRLGVTFDAIVIRAERSTHREIEALRRQCDAIAISLARTRQSLNRIDAMAHPDHVDDAVLVLRRQVLRVARVELRESLVRAWTYLADRNE